MNRTIVVAATALVAVSAPLAGCSSMSLRSPTATAALAPTKGSQVSGTVSFTQKGDRVIVEAKVTGLTPGLHGFHVHEKGNCTAPDGSSAGPHFSPVPAQHGGPDTIAHHAGDLGNLTADSTGTAIAKIEVKGLSLGTGEDSIIGRSVIVHEKADDLKTQPSGASGARLACGLISKSQDKWF
jgi:Cu-Zn family superoxide dismutase